MYKESNLEKAFEDSIKGSELVNTGLDITEIAIDQLLNEGLLKELPLVKSLTAFVKTSYNIRDAIYIKKLLLFVLGIQEVSEGKRKNFIKEISVLGKEKNRLFEKILSTLDKLDDSEKAVILSRAFKHLIAGNLNLIQYYRIARVIEDMMLDEIQYFFYKYGHYVRTDETREKYYHYDEKIGENNLITTMIRNGLYETKDEIVQDDGFFKKGYKIKKTDYLTTLGEMFSELGFLSKIHFTNPID